MRRIRNSTFVAALAAAIVLAAASPAAASDGTDSPFGSWELMKIERGGTVYEIIMTIEPARVEMTSRCSHEDDLVEVVVSSAAEISGNELRITESDSDEKEHSPGYLRCKAAISPKTLEFEIDDGKLVLTDPARPKPMVLAPVRGE